MTLELRQSKNMVVRMAPFNVNVSRVDAFLLSAEDYYELCEMKYKDLENRPTHSTLLPLMHCCLELLVKANAAHADGDFDPKKFSHKTSRIVRTYSTHIDTFKRFSKNESEMQMLDALERAWSAVRYGEVAYEFGNEDYLLFKKMANELADELTNSKIIRPSGTGPIPFQFQTNIKVTRIRANPKLGES